MSATTGYNYQQRGYAPRPISPAGPNRQASTPSPEQLNAARNIAWTHHQELGAYLRSKSVLLVDRPVACKAYRFADFSVHNVQMAFPQGAMPKKS